MKIWVTPSRHDLNMNIYKQNFNIDYQLWELVLLVFSSRWNSPASVTWVCTITLICIGSTSAACLCLCDTGDRLQKKSPKQVIIPWSFVVACWGFLWKYKYRPQYTSKVKVVAVKLDHGRPNCKMTWLLGIVWFTMFVYLTWNLFFFCDMKPCNLTSVLGTNWQQYKLSCFVLVHSREILDFWWYNANHMYGP